MNYFTEAVSPGGSTTGGGEEEGPELGGKCGREGARRREIRGRGKMRGQLDPLCAPYPPYPPHFPHLGWSRRSRPMRAGLSFSNTRGEPLTMFSKRKTSGRCSSTRYCCVPAMSCIIVGYSRSTSHVLCVEVCGTYVWTISECETKKARDARMAVRRVQTPPLPPAPNSPSYTNFHTLLHLSTP